jgi:hypothetical protein
MTRHRFEPARLLVGLLLCGAATAYLLDAWGVVELAAGLLAGLVPAALLLGALTGAASYAVRRARARRAGGGGGG